MFDSAEVMVGQRVIQDSCKKRSVVQLILKKKIRNLVIVAL